MYQDTSEVKEQDLVNPRTVLELYRSGKLHFDHEKVAVWFGDRLVVEPMMRCDLIEMTKVVWKGRRWHEEVCQLRF